MKRNLKCLVLSFLLVALYGCDYNKNSNDESFVDSSSSINENERIYEIEVKKDNNDAISNALVSFYHNDVIAYSATTNDDGIAYISAEIGVYDVKLDNLPRGYRPIQNEYKTDSEGSKISVVCNVRPYEDDVALDYRYTNGDIMHDFTVENIEGNELNLINLLNEKELVLLNFWYKNCQFCDYEMPFLESVYERYKNRIEIIAFNPFDNDNVIKDYKEAKGLSFEVVRDYLEIYNNFSVTGFPTTVVIDKRGIIRNIHSNAFQSENEFEAYIELFINSYVEPGDIIVDNPDDPTIEIVKPNVEMPSSKEIEAIINGENFNYSYFGAEGDDIEYNWPFIISEDGQSIHPSNQTYHNSYSIIQTKVNMKKDEVFTFDYLTSCENYDILYVLVDKEIVASISGLSTNWETAFTYVAENDGEYLISFCYQKDGVESLGDDTVYIKNLRILPSSCINEPTYILRKAATDKNLANGFNTYVDVVYNEKDGYYHVKSVDGPILLATLLTYSNFSDYTIYDFALNGFFIFDGVDYTDRITEYARLCANNETGCACVTQELYFLLDTFMKNICEESLLAYNENKWLETCVYFQAYGTNGKELADPNLGLAIHSAYKGAKEGNDNKIYVNGPIIPRPIYSEFIPNQTGVYKIETQIDEETILFMYDKDGNEIAIYDEGSRKYFHIEEGQNYADAIMYVNLIANQPYYVGANFYDMYQTGEITFSIEYLGTSFANFEFCSPGYFTSEEDEFGNMTGQLIAIALDCAIGEDGYYHVLNEDGTLGSIIYADFVYATSIFDYSIAQLINMGAFNFSVDEEGNRTNLEDKTEEIKKYLKEVIRQQGDTYGCVPVDEKLCELLQMLMDKYTFANVEGSWQKLCYYYHQYGE